MRRRSAALAPLCVLAVLATVLTGCSTRSAPAPPTTSAPEDGPLVVTIGDSITSGLGVSPTAAWPNIVSAREHWNVVDLGVPGAGFVATGSNGATYDAQVSSAIRLGPSVVLVSATDNDLGTDLGHVGLAATSDVTRLRTALPHVTIIGISALSGAATSSELAGDDEAVHSAIRASGGTWLDLGQPFRGKPGLVQGDGEHPTADGQQVIGDLVADRLEALDLAPGVAWIRSGF